MTNDNAATGDHPSPDVTATTDEVAGFFPWANLKGSKYRDYSASRDKIRATARGNSDLKQSTADDAARSSAPGYAPREVREIQPAPVKAASIPFAVQSKAGARPRTRNVPPEPRRLNSQMALRSQNDYSRWVALKGAFDSELNRGEENIQAPDPCHVPSIAFFSLAGGTGKTAITACIGCLLAADRIPTLLVDTHVYGLMSLFFGARELSPGTSRTFASADSAPVRVMTLDRTPQDNEHDTANEHTPLEQIVHHAEGVGRILIDVSTASIELLRQILPLSPTLLVVLVPDMASVVSLQAVHQVLEELEEKENGPPIKVFYVLNQFEPALRLHRDVRERLTRQLGKRLLPFAIQRTNAVSEALAEGMTVVDYAPDAQTTEALRDLADWVRTLEEPAASEARDMRMGER